MTADGNSLVGFSVGRALGSKGSWISILQKIMHQMSMGGLHTQGELNNGCELFSEDRAKRSIFSMGLVLWRYSNGTQNAWWCERGVRFV